MQNQICMGAKDSLHASMKLFLNHVETVFLFYSHETHDLFILIAEKINGICNCCRDSYFLVRTNSSPEITLLVRLI